MEPGSYTNAEATSLPGNVDTGNPANNGTPLRPVSGTRDPERSRGPLNGSGSDPENFAPATFRTPDDEPSVQDGDEVVLRYSAPGTAGGRITLGEVSGRILPAH